jgi:hypothetical protein
VAEILFLLHVKMKHLFDLPAVEKTPVVDPFWGQKIEQHIFQFRPQPVLDGNAEAFFSPVDILPGEKPVHGFFENPFGC